MDFLPIWSSGERVYAGFWKRFSAAIIDLIIMAPIVYMYLLVRLQVSDKNSSIGITIICSFVFAMYNVFFNAQFGGSPGKLALGIRITKPDGSYIGWGEAWKRSSVDLVYTSLILCCNVFGLAQVEADQYSALGFSDRSRLLQTYYPP